MSTTRAVAIGVAVLCLAAPALAEWSHDATENNLVCGQSNTQAEPAIAPDGDGGAFVAWVDNRTGDFDVYAQHLNSRGTPLWVLDGVIVCDEAGEQNFIQLASGGAGGVIIVWADGRGPDLDIYAQRLDSAGSQVWPAGGVELCGEPLDQMFPRMMSDGDGGAFVVWLDCRTGSSVDVYAQHLDALGNELWTSSGVAVCTGLFADDVRMASDGQSGVIISWYDARSGNGDVYAQRLDENGSAQWTTNGEGICVLASWQTFPRIVSDDAGGAIIVWRDQRGSSDDIYAQRVGPNGNDYWTADGVAVCDSPSDQLYPELTSDGAHGAIICWQDLYATDNDVYAQRVDYSGAKLWATDGVVLRAGETQQRHPEIASDGAGGAMVVMLDDGLAGYDLYGQRVDGSGRTLWGVNGTAFTTAAGDQIATAIATDAEGGGIVAWHDGRGADTDIYAQRIERNGYLGYPSGEIVSVRDVPGDQGGQVNLAWNASYLDPWPLMEIDNYTLWRAISPTRGGVHLPEDAVVLTSAVELQGETVGPVFMMEERARGTFYWELVATVDAYHIQTYAAVVPTLFDSTATSGEYHYFRTIAHACAPDTFWVSLPDSGRSVDNLAPGAPLALLAGVVSLDVELLWSPSGYHDEDLDHYEIHRSEVPGFVPGGTTFIGAATDTTFTDLDPGPTTWYYRVVAEDVHGNEGDPSNEAVATLGTGIDGPETPAVFALRGSFPNPLNPTTRVVFDLPTPAHVTVDVYSIDGRRVATLVEGPMEAGRQSVQWDGTDDGVEVPGGVYLYRVEAGSERAQGKIVVVR